MTETTNDIEGSTRDKPVLSYGRQSRRTWHRWALRLIVVLALGAAAWQFYPHIYHWFEMRAAIREVTVWHQQARTFVIPPAPPRSIC